MPLLKQENGAINRPVESAQIYQRIGGLTFCVVLKRMGWCYEAIILALKKCTHPPRSVPTFLLRGLLPEHGSDDHQGYSNERSAVDAGFQRRTQDTAHYGNHNANAKKQFASKPGEILHCDVSADDCLWLELGAPVL